jgi:hypothetical protein
MTTASTPVQDLELTIMEEVELLVSMTKVEPTAPQVVNLIPAAVATIILGTPPLGSMTRLLPTSIAAA